MLVLSRQRDEAILFAEKDDTIVVTVVDIRGDKVRLGVNAPGHFAIFRQELYHQILHDIKAGKQPPENRARPNRGMLVLSRQRDETLFFIDTRAGLEGWKAPFGEVTVVDIRGDKVRLGCKADRVTPIHRKEVADAIRREEKKAEKPQAC